MDFIYNNNTDDYHLNQKSQRVTLFKFELSQSQSIITLIFALTGLFLIPVLLAGEIFISLFDYIFITYFSISYQLVPSIANIIIYSFFFILSFITVRRLLRGLGGEGAQKSNIIPYDRIVKWFGLKLSHGQAIFIFSLSIMGIPFLIIRILGIRGDPYNTLYNELLSIPVGNYSFYYNDVLLNNAPLILDGLFFILCMYSIFATRRRKKASTNQLKTTSNLGVFIFIVSFVILVLYLLRLIAHLFILFTDIPILFEIYPQTKNIYQLKDFLNVLIILISSSVFLVFSYFLKKGVKKVQKEKELLTWFHVELTKNRYIVLLSYTIMCLCLLGSSFALEFFTYGLWYSLNQGILFYVIPFLLILYSLFKIKNKDDFHRNLTQFNDPEDFKAKWFKFKVNRLQSVMICTVSSGAIFFYIFYIIVVRTMLQLTQSGEYYMLYFVQDISLISSLSILLLFSLYTIKCTYKAVKSR